MRLTPHQTDVILEHARVQFGHDVAVSLFGSRLDDSARGGDLDLLVESDARPTVRQRAYLKMALEEALMLPVDIVAVQRGLPCGPFARIARSRAIALKHSV